MADRQGAKNHVRGGRIQRTLLLTCVAGVVPVIVTIRQICVNRVDGRNGEKHSVCNRAEQLG